ncbi:hypothetical protein LAZ67_9000588 [Cordylochernes scorpioides]|uniref:Peptidase M12A domain-containing protein n=1 Tax=Cordylochernes scorpioides TaxID=51811 RepID=A0ABY6KSK4_9ARAC|nr:hypothetical protein LAZ67_9000588 [Cordylochernes scorpioides]
MHFHQENARAHTSRQTTALIEAFEWELVSHPLHSPDIATSDFNLFTKKNLGGTQFQDDGELEEAVLGFLRGYTDRSDLLHGQDITTINGFLAALYMADSNPKEDIHTDKASLLAGISTPMPAGGVSCVIRVSGGRKPPADEERSSSGASSGSDYEDEAWPARFHLHELGNAPEPAPIVSGHGSVRGMRNRVRTNIVQFLEHQQHNKPELVVELFQFTERTVQAIILLHVVQAMIIMQFDFALTNARAPLTDGDPAFRACNNFDYESIMIYGETAFSKDDRSKTIEDKNKVHKLTNPYSKKGMSKYDIERHISMDSLCVPIAGCAAGLLTCPDSPTSPWCKEKVGAEFPVRFPFPASLDALLNGSP